MPVPDLESYKVAGGELSSATKFNNLVQAIEDEFADIDPDQIAGYPADATKFLRGDGAWAAPSGAGYGTSLPGSPVDGQEYVLVDSTTNPTYQWRFRYNASSAHGDKWEFVGGAPALVVVAADEATGSTGAYVALTTAGPSFALPRAGVYHIAIGCHTIVASSQSDAFMSYDIGATGAVDADAAEGVGRGQVGEKNTPVFEQVKAGLTAVTLTAKYKSVGANGNFKKRWMRVTPVRVS